MNAPLLIKPPRIEFTVIGLPQPAGSKRAFPFRGKEGRLHVAVSDANPKSRDWKNQVSAAVREQYRGQLLDGPIAVEMAFFLPRPKGHFGTGLRAGHLKKSAPVYPTVKPDVLKLARAVEDALSKIAYKDDSQTVKLSLRKFYGEPARVQIAIQDLSGDAEALDRSLGDTSQADTQNKALNANYPNYITGGQSW